MLRSTASTSVSIPDTPEFALYELVEEWSCWDSGHSDPSKHLRIHVSGIPTCVHPGLVVAVARQWFWPPYNTGQLRGEAHLTWNELSCETVH